MMQFDANDGDATANIVVSFVGTVPVSWLELTFSALSNGSVPSAAGSVPIRMLLFKLSRLQDRH
jgi:hypothetical protein